MLDLYKTLTVNQCQPVFSPWLFQVDRSKSHSFLSSVAKQNNIGVFPDLPTLRNFIAVNL